MKKEIVIFFEIDATAFFKFSNGFSKLLRFSTTKQCYNFRFKFFFKPIYLATPDCNRFIG